MNRNQLKHYTAYNYIDVKFDLTTLHDCDIYINEDVIYCRSKIYRLGGPCVKNKNLKGSKMTKMRLPTEVYR